MDTDGKCYKLMNGFMKMYNSTYYARMGHIHNEERQNNQINSVIYRQI